MRELNEHEKNCEILGENPDEYMEQPLSKEEIDYFLNDLKMSNKLFSEDNQFKYEISNGHLIVEGIEIFPAVNVQETIVESIFTRGYVLGFPVVVFNYPTEPDDYDISFSDYVLSRSNVISNIVMENVKHMKPDDHPFDYLDGTDQIIKSIPHTMHESA